MITCDRCKKSDNWPGRMFLRVELSGYHIQHEVRGPNNWSFDCCKECAVLLKQKLDQTVKEFFDAEARIGLRLHT